MLLNQEWRRGGGGDIEELLDTIHSYAGNDVVHQVIVAAIIIAVTALISHILTRLIRRVMQIDGITLPSSSILVNVERIAVWALGIYTMLSACFNVDVNALVAALGIGGIALSLGMQDTLKNFIGGLQVTLLRIVEPDDHVIVNGVEGIVHDVNWRQTVVTDYERAIHIIPNSVINTSGVTKIKPSNLVTSVVVLNTDGRDLDAVLAKMEQVAKKAVEKVAPLEKDPWMLVTQIGEYGVWCKMRFVLKDADHAREARDAALRAIAPYARNNASEVMR